MERAHKNPQVLLALLAMAFVVAAIWAATGLAGGSPSAASDSGGSQPVVEFVQEDDSVPAEKDCPESEDGSGGSSGAGDSSGSSSTDF